MKDCRVRRRDLSCFIRECVATEGSSREGAERDQLLRMCTVIRPTLFLAKDSGQVFKPLEWAVRASGMRSPVQGPGCGGSARRGGGGGAMERKGQARFPPLTNSVLLERSESLITTEPQIQK